MLQSNKEYPMQLNRILKQILEMEYNNSVCTMGQQSVYIKAWVQKNIERVSRVLFDILLVQKIKVKSWTKATN